MSGSGRLGGFGEFIGQPLTVRSAVINDGDFLGTEFVDRVLAQHVTLLFVVGHHPKRGVVALCGIRDGCGGRRYLRDACVVVDRRRRNGGT